jgi:hypothetical protein
LAKINLLSRKTSRGRIWFETLRSDKFLFVISFFTIFHPKIFIRKFVRQKNFLFCILMTILRLYGRTEHYTTHQSCLYEHPNEYTLHHDALFLQNPSPHNFFLSVHLPSKFYVWKLFSVYIMLCLCLFLSVCLSVLCLSSQQTNFQRGTCLCVFLHILRCVLSTLFILSIW